ncbi:MAG: winged helix-turn-helix domain-containing protein [Verrucomicrobia bacterium]|nr:winged helix-turn-helix domain-containing protein [Verrucomicrobiota bacterium]
MRPKIQLIDGTGRAAVKAALAETTAPAVRLAFRGQHTLAEISGDARLCALQRGGVYPALSPARRRGPAVQGAWRRPRQAHQGRRRHQRRTARRFAPRPLEARQGNPPLAGGKARHALGLAGVYTWLRRRGAKPKVPHKSHGKQDPAKAAAFKNPARRRTRRAGPAAHCEGAAVGGRRTSLRTDRGHPQGVAPAQGQADRTWHAKYQLNAQSWASATTQREPRRGAAWSLRAPASGCSQLLLRARLPRLLSVGLYSGSHQLLDLEVGLACQRAGYKGKSENYEALALRCLHHPSPEAESGATPAIHHARGLCEKRGDQNSGRPFAA